MDFARVLGAGEVLRVGGAQLHGDHLTTGSVSPEFDSAPQLLVVGGGRVPLDVDLEPLVVPGDGAPVLDLPCGPYPLGGARGRGVLEGQLHPGADGVFGIQGSGFLFGPALRLGPWLWRGFGLCGGLALLRTLAAPGSWLSPLGRCALGLLYGCVARCKHGSFAGGWDVRLGRGDGVLQLEHLLGHEAEHFLGLLQGIGLVRGPGEEPVPGACPVAAHVGCVAGVLACPRWGAFRGEGAFWRPLRPVEGVVQRFPGCL